MESDAVASSSFDIHVHGMVYTLYRTPEESMDLFLSRCWWIATRHPTTPEELQRYIIQSRQWIYETQYNMTFPKTSAHE